MRTRRSRIHKLVTTESEMSGASSSYLLPSRSSSAAPTQRRSQPQPQPPPTTPPTTSSQNHHHHHTQPTTTTVVPLDPSPNPLPIFQYLSLCLILFLGLLQFFLPATHIRDPNDPFKSWLPVNSSSYLTRDRASSTEHTGSSASYGGDDGFVHVVSWMNCLDLRVLTVLTNSTLTSSRNPDLIHFHFFVPGGSNDKISFYKLKVLFPHSNLEIHGREAVEEVIRKAMPELQPNFDQLAPFAIPSILPSLNKFIYVSSNLIVKILLANFVFAYRKNEKLNNIMSQARVEELVSIDLQNYDIAAAEDCSQRLSAHINTDVLDAIQRSASKPWVSDTPYEKDACVPDLNVLLIDGRRLGKDILETIFWWTRVLNWNERSGQRNPAIFLALYDKNMKLSSSWSINNEISGETEDKRTIIPYDGPVNVCSASGARTLFQPKKGNLWMQYLPPLSSQILGE